MYFLHKRNTQVAIALWDEIHTEEVVSAIPSLVHEVCRRAAVCVFCLFQQSHFLTTWTWCMALCPSTVPLNPALPWSALTMCKCWAQPCCSACSLVNIKCPMSPISCPVTSSLEPMCSTWQNIFSVTGLICYHTLYWVGITVCFLFRLKKKKVGWGLG